MSAWIGRLAALACGALGLWTVFSIYAAGQTMVAVIALVLLCAGLYVYATAASTAWRYLFPGVVGMLMFVAFPLVYTTQIGFTNYSSSHLLSEDRARDYLLEQAEFDTDRTLVYTVHPEARGWRVRLAPQPGQAGESYVSSLITQASESRPWDATLQPEAAAGVTLAPAQALPQVLVQHRGQLMHARLALPDGRVLQYAGVHEFGVSQPLWRVHGTQGELERVADGAVFVPNREAGWFERETVAGPRPATASADGEAVTGQRPVTSAPAEVERLQPGFKVGVGFANYIRMIEDKEFRGPFLSIFLWTVTFATLTVVFALALGMGLAVLLNWESLRYRTLYRTLLFLPYAVPAFISILIFKGLFNQNFGEINAILNAVFGVRPAWFADPLLAKVMLLTVNVWLGYPYFLVLCTGLLKAIPHDLYEASALAGASPWTNFSRITAPLVIKPLAPLMISAFAYNFNNFVLISLLTNGRPDYLNTKIPAGTNDILVSYTYRIAFSDSGQNFGLAAAISTVIFLLVALLSFANLKFSNAGQARK